MTSKPSKVSPDLSSGRIKLNPRLREAFDNFVSTWIDTMESMSQRDRETIRKICERQVKNVLKVTKPRARRMKKKRRR